MYRLPSTAFRMRQSVRKVSMDVNHSAALELVKVHDPPRGKCVPIEPIAEKELTVTSDEVDKAPAKTLVLDPSTWLSKLSAGKPQHEYLPDEPVFSQGDPADAVFYIQSGKLQLTVKSAEGEQAVISILPEGNFLGECCLAGQTIRSATASALMSSTIVRIEKQAMMDLLRSDSEFTERFLSYMLSRGISIEAALVSRLVDSSDKRLSRMRGKKARLGAEWKPIPVTARMSPESLAEVVGTTSSKVRFFLDCFRELGFIDSSGDELLVHGSLMSIVPHDDGIC